MPPRTPSARLPSRRSTPTARADAASRACLLAADAAARRIVAGEVAQDRGAPRRNHRRRRERSRSTRRGAYSRSPCRASRVPAGHRAPLQVARPVEACSYAHPRRSTSEPSGQNSSRSATSSTPTSTSSRPASSARPSTRTSANPPSKRRRPRRCPRRTAADRMTRGGPPRQTSRPSRTGVPVNALRGRRSPMGYDASAVRSPEGASEPTATMISNAEARAS